MDGTKKAEEKKKMEEEKNSDSKPLDKSKYHDFDDEGKGLRLYLYEKKIGKAHQYETKSEDEKDDDKKDKGEELTGVKA